MVNGYVTCLEKGREEEGYRRTRLRLPLPLPLYQRQHGSTLFLHAFDGGERILSLKYLIEFLVIDFQSETEDPIYPFWGPVLDRWYYLAGVQ